MNDDQPEADVNKYQSETDVQNDQSETDVKNDQSEGDFKTLSPTFYPGSNWGCFVSAELHVHKRVELSRVHVYGKPGGSS